MVSYKDMFDLEENYDSGEEEDKDKDKDEEHIVNVFIELNKNKNNIEDCVKSNYIPHKSPNNITREKWHNYYLYELIDIYEIFIDIFEEKFNGYNVNWKNPKYFHNFSRLLYHCSSKFIYKDNN